MLFRGVRQALETIVLTVAIFLFLVTFVIQGYKVYGSCMEPNLNTGERLLASRFVYRFGPPSRGDVIVFRYPLDPKKTFIKRVVGLPGDTIEIRAGRVYIDGKRLNEGRYVKNSPHGDFPSEKIRDGSVFVLGDNRDQSNDSRSWGLLPVTNIKAKAWLRYWPPSRMTFVR